MACHFWLPAVRFCLMACHSWLPAVRFCLMACHSWLPVLQFWLQFWEICPSAQWIGPSGQMACQQADMGDLRQQELFLQSISECREANAFHPGRKKIWQFLRVLPCPSGLFYVHMSPGLQANQTE